MTAGSAAGTDGEWIEKGLVWQQDGLLYFSMAYLRRPEYSDVVNPSIWLKWTTRPCADLDHRVNGGLIGHLVTRGRSGRKTIVYLQADVKQIIKRRTDTKARLTDPA